MIVIPTNNGYWHLDRLIKSMETYGADDHVVTIVDTGTKDIVSKKYLDSLQEYQGSLRINLINSTPEYCYEMAAIQAVLAHPFDDEKFLLIHDSCEATSDQWIKQFDEKLTRETGAVAWIKFQPCLFCCWDEHFHYMDNICNHEDVPDSGFFGGIFYTYGDILKDFFNKGFFNYPAINKRHSEAWERIWAILYHQAGYKADHIIYGFNPAPIHGGVYPHMRKNFGGRQ